MELGIPTQISTPDLSMEMNPMTHFLMPDPQPKDPHIHTGISYIIEANGRSSAPVAAKDFLGGLDAEGLALLRRTDHQRRRDGTPRFHCGFCKDPVHIRVISVAEGGAMGGRRASFAHDPRASSRDCPFGTFADQTSPARIDGERFKGRQEGARHRFLKTLLCDMLAADPNIATADCEVLVTGLAQDGTASWRRPDVLAVTTGGQRIAFDVQIASPLLATIDGRERFYAAQGIAWHWIVDMDQPERLKLQGFQDLILPQACRVLGFNEQIALTAEYDKQSRFHLLHVKENIDLRIFNVRTKEIGLEDVLRLAGHPSGGPARYATDLRAVGFFRALYRGERDRAGQVFDLIAVGCGAPDSEIAQQDHLPEALATVLSLIGERREQTLEDKLSRMLATDQPDQSSGASPRDWAFLLQRIAAKDSGVRTRIETCSAENRTLLNQALHAIIADPIRSQKLWAKWTPLLRRLFPRLA